GGTAAPRRFFSRRGRHHDRAGADHSEVGDLRAHLRSAADATRHPARRRARRLPRGRCADECTHAAQPVLRAHRLVRCEVRQECRRGDDRRADAAVRRRRARALDPAARWLAAARTAVGLLATLLHDAWVEYQRDRARYLAVAIIYYAAICLVPMLLLLL